MQFEKLASNEIYYAQRKFFCSLKIDCLFFLCDSVKNRRAKQNFKPRCNKRNCIDVVVGCKRTHTQHIHMNTNGICLYGKRD